MRWSTKFWITVNEFCIGLFIFIYIFCIRTSTFLEDHLFKFFSFSIDILFHSINYQTNDTVSLLLKLLDLFLFLSFIFYLLFHLYQIFSSSLQIVIILSCFRIIVRFFQNLFKLRDFSLNFGFRTFFKWVFSLYYSHLFFFGGSIRRFLKEIK